MPAPGIPPAWRDAVTASSASNRRSTPAGDVERFSAPMFKGRTLNYICMAVVGETAASTARPGEGRCTRVSSAFAWATFGCHGCLAVAELDGIRRPSRARGHRHSNATRTSCACCQHAMPPGTLWTVRHKRLHARLAASIISGGLHWSSTSTARKQGCRLRGGPHYIWSSTSMPSRPRPARMVRATAASSSRRESCSSVPVTWQSR